MDFKNLPTWQDLTGDLQSLLEDASKFYLEEDDNYSFDSPYLSVILASNSYIPTQSINPGAYHWRVNGHNEFFTGPWSTTWRVVILDVPGVPALVSPEDGSLIGD
jgi:hypothetical protein